MWPVRNPVFFTGSRIYNILISFATKYGLVDVWRVWKTINWNKTNGFEV